MENNLEVETKLTTQKTTILIVFIFLISVIFFSMFPPEAVDWRNTFYHSAQTPLQPYEIRSFNYPPWTALIIFPLSFFSEKTGLVLNATIALITFIFLIIKRNGKLLSIILTMTSFPVLSGISNGTLEWIPALGFVLQDGAGLILLLAKPQSGIFTGIDWFFRSKNKILFLLIPGLTLALSLLIWKGWPIKVYQNILYVQNRGFSEANISLFPWSIPIGLGLIYYIIKNRPKNSELLGVLATVTFTPYSAFHSYSILFALTSISYPRASILVWVLLWILAFVVN